MTVRRSDVQQCDHWFAFQQPECPPRWQIFRFRGLGPVFAVRTAGNGFDLGSSTLFVPVELLDDSVRSVSLISPEMPSQLSFFPYLDPFKVCMEAGLGNRDGPVRNASGQFHRRLMRHRDGTGRA